MCVNENIRLCLGLVVVYKANREREHLLESGGRPRLSNYESSISRRSDSLSLSLFLRE